MVQALVLSVVSCQVSVVGCVLSPFDSAQGDVKVMLSLPALKGPLRWQAGGVEALNISNFLNRKS
jgi:hypothetical protein